ncbi:hypothetical protein [Streptomyces sp. NBC_00236]|uniref:hypothetical protein n=1 Tax=Streptomyces sp. NBC_00236 TaxID=2903639 RepID=UPI002E28B9BF|nr:hypothetical protein [Streptomyces sp. NBC_00236]
MCPRPSAVLAVTLTGLLAVAAAAAALLGATAMGHGTGELGMPGACSATAPASGGRRSHLGIRARTLPAELVPVAVVSALAPPA